ncbi:MAG: hypothetical protein VX641_05510 [Planctomycetota bacterium]|nr:hypothetical protein [Planctomycetota bacterium]
MQTPPDPGKMRLITLCRHDLPSAPPHLDLFLGPEGPAGEDDQVVRTWRLDEDPMSMPDGAVQSITPLRLHRARYLQLEEPAEPRSTEGLVTPLRRGSCHIEHDSDGVLRLRIRWSDGSQGRFQLDLETMQRLPSTESES